MDIREAIRSRRSIFRFRPELVPPELLEQIIGFGVWAPNHHLTEPWRFTALGEATRQRLARRYGELQLQKAPADATPELRAQLQAAGEAKFLSKPAVIVVSCLQQGDEQRRREDFAATCCAVQNLMLAGEEEGLASGWSTGGLAKHPRLRELIGAEPDWQFVALLYIGRPQLTTSLPPRQNAHAAYTTWLGDDGLGSPASV
jgi:nitroreductase